MGVVPYLHNPTRRLMWTQGWFGTSVGERLDLINGAAVQLTAGWKQRNSDFHTSQSQQAYASSYCLHASIPWRPGVVCIPDPPSPLPGTQRRNVSQHLDGFTIVLSADKMTSCLAAYIKSGSQIIGTSASSTFSVHPTSQTDPAR